MIKKCSHCGVKIGVIKDKHFVFCSNTHRAEFWAEKEKLVVKARIQPIRGYDVIYAADGTFLEYRRKVRKTIIQPRVAPIAETPAPAAEGVATT